MRSSGAGPALFGACLASAAIQCSCFTVSPRSVLSSTPRQTTAASRCSYRATELSAIRPWSAADPAAGATAEAAAGAAGRPSALGEASCSPAAARRQKQGRRQNSRRKTRLSSTKERSSGGNGSGTATATQTAPPQTTSQKFRAEVEARRAAGGAGTLLPPVLRDDRDRAPCRARLGDGRSGPIRGAEVAALLEASSVAAGAAAFERQRVILGVAATPGEALDRRPLLEKEDKTEKGEDGGYCDSDGAAAAAREQQRVLDMTTPPAELMKAAETRPVGDGEAAPEAAEASGKLQVFGGGDGGGVGLWASRGMLAGAAMLYGTNFGCVKLLEESVPMSLAASLRFSVAVIPFIPFLRNISPGVFVAGAEIGVLNAVGYWAQSEALMTTSASKAAFICSLSVILVPVLDAMFGEKDSKEVKAVKAEEKKSAGGVFATLNGPWFPALLAAAGVACLELIGVEGGPSVGDAWALIQPLCFGIGFWRTERLSRKYPGDTFGLVAAQLLAVAVLASGWCAQAGQLPLSLESLRETVLPASGSLAVPISLMWTGLMTTALTVFAETLAMQKISAAESTIILSTEPLWGTAFAAVLLGETIGWNTGLGAMLIVSACTWTSVGPALQSKLLSLIATTGAVGTVGEVGLVDVDDLTETVESVVQELVKERL